MMTEAQYDELIAPKLEAIAKECAALGSDIVAVVEYGNNARGETRTVGADSSLAMKLLTFCANAGENLDAFFINVTRHCRKHNIDTSGSMVMSMLNRSEGKREGGGQ